MNKRIQLFPEAMSQARAGWMVQSDFDGTISLLDVTDTLLNRFGKPGWQELEEAWERGDIGSRECMKGQVALLDMSEAELQAHLDLNSVLSHTAQFMAQALRILPAHHHGVGLQRQCLLGLAYQPQCNVLYLFPRQRHALLYRGGLLRFALPSVLKCVSLPPACGQPGRQRRGLLRSGHHAGH